MLVVDPELHDAVRHDVGGFGLGEPGADHGALGRDDDFLGILVGVSHQLSIAAFIQLFVRNCIEVLVERSRLYLRRC